MSKKKDKGDEQLEYVGQLIGGFFKSVVIGVKQCWRSRICGLTFVGVSFFSFVVFRFRGEIVEAFLPGYEGPHVLKIAMYAVAAMPVLCLFLFGSGENEKEDQFQKKFERIRFCGKDGSYPVCKSQQIDGKKIIYAFYSPGLPAIEWKNKIIDLESVLNCNIIKVEQAPKTKQVVLLHTVPADQGIVEDLLWDDAYIREKDFELCVGEGILDQVAFDLNKYPHALIAGVTGSGKSVILRCMLWQCIRKGARIYMIDFKGGVEFSGQYEQYGEVVTDRQSVLELLKELVNEMWLRLEVFRQTGVKNLAEYNALHPEKPLSRIVLVCDEVAEMLDKAGVVKEEKAIYFEIEKEISTLARLARAPGINMLLATQRPDAKVITGQIKNNLPIRISGRMVDKQASEMVLGNTKASNLGDTLGRFLYSVGSDTFEFQVYNFKDTLTPGTYQKGGLLIDDAQMAEMMEPSEEEEPLDEMVSEDNDEYDEEIDDYEGF